MGNKKQTARPNIPKELYQKFGKFIADEEKYLAAQAAGLTPPGARQKMSQSEAMSHFWKSRPDQLWKSFHDAATKSKTKFTENSASYVELIKSLVYSNTDKFEEKVVVRLRCSHSWAKGKSRNIRVKVRKFAFKNNSTKKLLDLFCNTLIILVRGQMEWKWGVVGN